MSKITQIVAQPFGNTASAGQIGEFGSKAAGSPTTTTDPTAMQSLSPWSQGWFSAVINGNSPCIQDMNAFCFVVMYIFTYLQEMGISEWNAGITYYTGSIVNVSGQLYVSLVDNNTNHAPASSPTQWTIPGGSSRTTTSTDTITNADNIVFANPTSGSFVENLPAASACPANFKVTIKNIATNGNIVTLTPNGGDTIDGMSSWVLNSGISSGQNLMDSVTLVAKSGTGWYII